MSNGYIARGKVFKTDQGNFVIPYITISSSPGMEFYVTKFDNYPVASLTYSSSTYQIDESTYAVNNRLWIKHNMIRNPVVDSLQSGVETDYLTNNNWRLTLKKNGSYLEVRLYDSDNVLVASNISWFFGVYLDNAYPNMFFSVVECDDYPDMPILVMCRCRYNSDQTTSASNQGFDSLPGDNNYSGFLTGSVVSPYNWTSWDKIAGNGGQYSATMTQIKDSVISDVDPAAYKVLEDGDFDVISATSSIWNTYLNALLGEEYTIAWSGNNKATLTVTNHATDPGIKIFTFKFYLGATLAPFLMAQEEVIVGGENPALITHNYYLTFLYDTEEEVAAFYPVRYMPNGALIKYAHQSFPELSEVTMQNLYTWLMASENAPEGSGPYDTGTTDNGGTPTGGGHQDPMPTIHVPVLSGGASGMFTIYCPTDTQLGDIADFLWSDNVLDNFKKYFNNFSDNIIALYVLPYKAANLPTKAFKVGKMQSQDITGVEYVTTRFVSIPMGEITVDTRWDSYLDFEPYTKFNIYLPGIGVQALSADDIICPPNMDESMPIAKGSKISLEYVLDLMTGNVAAYVKINGQIRYQFTGKVGYSIPITGANYSSMVQGYVMATAGLIGTLATGGTAAPFAASAGAAGIINAMKPDVYRGGNLSGDSSSMCLEYPYLIRRRPNKPYVEDQEEFTGFPSYKTGKLSEFSGYTEVLDAHVEGISCTEEEREKILAALKGGVII